MLCECCYVTGLVQMQPAGILRVQLFASFVQCECRMLRLQYMAPMMYACCWHHGSGADAAFTCRPKHDTCDIIMYKWSGMSAACDM